MPEVEMQAAACGSHHRGHRVAVLAQLLLALGAVHVEDQDAGDGPGDNTDAWPGPRGELFFRRPPVEVWCELAEGGLLAAPLYRDRAPAAAAIFDRCRLRATHRCAPDFCRLSLRVEPPFAIGGQIWPGCRGSASSLSKTHPLRVLH